MGKAVYSLKAEKAYNYLLLVGAAPFDAIVVATKLKKGSCNKGLNTLRGAGYAYPERIMGTEWWILEDNISIPLPRFQEVLAWFVARLHEAGGDYSNGIVRYPKGQEYSLELADGCVQTGDIVFYLEDLINKPLRECFRKNEGHNLKHGAG